MTALCGGSGGIDRVESWFGIGSTRRRRERRRRKRRRRKRRRRKRRRRKRRRRKRRRSSLSSPDMCITKSLVLKRHVILSFN